MHITLLSQISICSISILRLTYSYPRPRPIQSATCTLIPGSSNQYAFLSQYTLILRQYPFSLCIPLSSWVRPFSLHFFKLIRSHPGLIPIQSAHCALTLGSFVQYMFLSRCTLILRWYLFSLHVALSSWVRSFSLRFFKLTRSHPKMIHIQSTHCTLILGSSIQYELFWSLYKIFIKKF